MTDTDWGQRVEDAIKRLNERGREEYLDIVDDIVAGLDAPAILAKRSAKERALQGTIADITAVVHAARPLPPLAAGGWMARDGDVFEVAKGFAKAWKAARKPPSVH